MTEDNETAGPPKLNSAGSSPPKLRKPVSSGLKMFGMAAAFITLTTGYAIFSGGSDSTDGYSGETMTVDNTVGTDEAVNIATDGQGESLEPPFETLSQNGAQVKTAFGTDWSARVLDRQILFTDPSGIFLCQSLVVPIEEYLENMSQVGGDIGQYAAEFTKAQAASGGATAVILSKEELQPGNTETSGATWNGAKVAYQYEGTDRKMVIYIASSETDQHGALLTCGAKESNDDGTTLDQLVRAYRLEAAA
jgi:hypothetical protein